MSTIQNRDLSNELLEGLYFSKNLGGIIQMKSNVKRLKVRWRVRKSIAWSTSIIITSLIISILFSAWFSKYTEKIWLPISIITTIIISIILFTITYLVIYIKSKKQIYHIDLERQIISIDRKTIRYEVVYKRKETIFQKCFELVTLEFVNQNSRIIRNDVSKEILIYIKTIQ